MKDLIILGAGGTSYDLVDIAVAMNNEKPQWNIVGFLDDNSTLHDSKVYGYQVLGNIEDASNFPNAFFASSIADAYKTNLRELVRNKVKWGNDRFASLIHPKSIISDTAVIESGAIIYANVTLSGAVHVGHNTFLCGNTFLGHECEIGSHCALSVGNFLASDVKVGNCSYLGVGVNVRHQIRIGENCLVGMGTVVVKDIPSNHKLINKLENVLTKL